MLGLKFTDTGGGVTPEQLIRARAALDAAREHAGNGTWGEFADALVQTAHEAGDTRLTLTRQAAQHWARAQVPLYWIRHIERLTDGAVQREHLRPDIYD